MKIRVSKLKDGVYKIISGDKVDHMVRTLEVLYKDKFKSGVTKITTAHVSYYIETSMDKNRVFVDPDDKLYVEAVLLTFAYGDIGKL